MQILHQGYENVMHCFPLEVNLMPALRLICIISFEVSSLLTAEIKCHSA